MDQQAAVDALERLGLSTYEAKVFIALVSLGVGSASDVAHVVDVPRSQVYGAADRLERHGLVDSRQSSPIQYRPVDLSEARDRLRRRFERDLDTAFEYLDDVHEAADPAEEQEGVWTVEGSEAVTGRLERLLAEASASALFTTGDAPLADERTVAALAEAAERGVGVTVLSASQAVLDRFDDRVATRHLPDLGDWEGEGGRLLLVDGRSVLLSVGGADASSPAGETAIWSADTAFAAVFVRLVEGRLGDYVA
ncbi:TrmB family transcriptional regulator [Halomarina ordinaria]|uniref:TrmB family transcriptional regulator n=1 Tax=Halomarina ordinaria TaxID=3033939 RepID=A0ABD5UBR3_9EURY|nr:helix-turn-helix domain-containing protein [Halomarina sp. PSRA2]